MTQTLYVVAPPSKKEWAQGYAAGLMEGAEDYFEAVEYEVVIRDDVPPDKVYVTAQKPRD